MAHKSLLVKGWNQYFDTLDRRNKIARQLVELRRQFRGPDFNPSLVLQAARRIVMTTAPEHPLAVPDALSSTLGLLAEPVEKKGSETYSMCAVEDLEGDRRDAMRRWVREISGLALFSARIARKLGLPLRRSRRFL